MAKKLKLTPPRLILITGVGGTGKTNVSKKLLKMVDASYVGKDDIADRYTQLRGEKYKNGVRNKVYELVYEEAKGYLNLGKTTIVDASFHLELKSPGWEKRYYNLATINGALFYIVRLIVSPNVLIQRIKDRNSSYDSHKMKDQETWRKSLDEEPIHVNMPNGTLIVNNDGDLASVADKVFAFIKEDISLLGY